LQNLLFINIDHKKLDAAGANYEVSIQPQHFALAPTTQGFMPYLDQGFSVGKPSLADLLAQKSRSTFNCPSFWGPFQLSLATMNQTNPSVSRF
jgi:hypothetical protein